MKRTRIADLRRTSKRALVPLIGLVTGCSPFDPSGGGCEPTPATDAARPVVSLDCRQPPCGNGREAVRGSDPHLMLQFDCPGTSKVFLAAIKVDGALRSMHDVQCSEYGFIVAVDAGHWEPADTVWHTVEVILDPLNLFEETDESNNRSSTQLRIVEPPARSPVGSGREPEDRR
jgi:hypothetical protein